MTKQSSGPSTKYNKIPLYPLPKYDMIYLPNPIVTVTTLHQLSVIRVFRLIQVFGQLGYRVWGPYNVRFGFKVELVSGLSSLGL